MKKSLVFLLLLAQIFLFACSSSVEPIAKPEKTQVPQDTYKVLMAKRGQLFSVTLEENQDWEYTLTPAQGIVLLEHKKGNPQVLIFKSIYPGTYLLKFELGEKEKQLKVIVAE